MFNPEDGLRLLVAMNVCMIFIVMRLNLGLFLLITCRKYFKYIDNKYVMSRLKLFPE